MHLDLGYTNARLVSTYDSENAGRDDIEFYLALAAELGSSQVLDLGCGTGVLAADLAVTGITVTGVDPAAAMLTVARGRPGGDQATWVLGDSDAFAAQTADLVIMTGHVAQVFLGDQEWAGVLANSFRALIPGGFLAFESRNPRARGWKYWNEKDSIGSYRLSNGDTFRSWVRVTREVNDLVTFEGHTVFDKSDEHLTATSTLRFRAQDELDKSLLAAGFEVDQLFGDWDRQQVSAESRELIYLARKPLQ